MEYFALDDSRPQGRGFWLRDSKIYEVSSSHVEFIVDHPELFDMTKERVQGILDWQHEPLGYEASAKEILIRHAACLGWIRIRNYLKPSDYWLFQADNTLKREEQIKNFLLWAISQMILESDSEAIIMGYHPCDCHRYRRRKGGVGRYLWENLREE